MSMRRKAVLQAGLLMVVAMFANAASRNNTIQIKVLDSETRALSLDDNGVPNNCDQATFDAYCRSSSTAPLMNTLLVQEGNEPPFRVTCTTASRNSRCMPLPKGATFNARRQKHGITVYYVDDKGKARGQFYKLVDTAESLARRRLRSQLQLSQSRSQRRMPGRLQLRLSRTQRRRCRLRQSPCLSCHLHPRRACFLRKLLRTK